MITHETHLCGFTASRLADEHRSSVFLEGKQEAVTMAVYGEGLALSFQRQIRQLRIYELGRLGITFQSPGTRRAWLPKHGHQAWEMRYVVRDRKRCRLPTRRRVVLR